MRYASRKKSKSTRKDIANTNTNTNTDKPWSVANVCLKFGINIVMFNRWKDAGVFEVDSEGRIPESNIREMERRWDEDDLL